MSSYRSLVAKFERTKRELGDTESTIRRITGRDPDEIMTSVPGSGKHRLGSSAAVPGRPSFSNKRKSPYIARKRSRERESSYEEESSSDYESATNKPAIQSTVVAKRHQKRSRKATIEEQNANSKINARNRRMFGTLVATLQKFQDEEVGRQDRESKRAKIEQKVEAAKEEEQERIKQEKEHLLVTRREKQTQLRCLEKKIERAESHEVYDANQHYLLNYIMTKSKPHIFYLPARHTSATRKYLEESKSRIRVDIKKCKESLENDLMEIEEWYKKDSSLPSDKENKCPKDESELQDVSETVSESLVVEQEDTDHYSNPTPNSSADPNTNTNLESNISNDDDSNSTKNVDSLADQDFEPIYD